MFDFREELAKYRESLSVEELSEGVSGDEVKDILDIARALVDGDISRENEERYRRMMEKIGK